MISIIIPVFNEEEVLAPLLSRLEKIKEDFKDEKLEIIFVDDGSSDKTFEILYSHATENKMYKILKFSRNFGHQIAISAGINKANGDYVAIIDADLQDPPELIKEMHNLAVQKTWMLFMELEEEEKVSLFLKISASLFYRFINYMSNIDIPKDTGDFRLISKKVVNEFKKMPEKHRFVRGLIPWIGLNSAPFYYERDERLHGSTKYPLKKMIQFASNAIFSFSRKPLILASKFGLTLIAGGISFGIYIVYLKFQNIPVPGLTSLIILITIFSGFQIFFIGILGEYIGRIFEESKERPLYIIEKTINL